MPAIVLVGAQWGDEGKGKATDLLGKSVDYVVKFNGGNNAGHTVVIEKVRAALPRCDGRHDSPGETVTAWVLHHLGFRTVPQFRVPGTEALTPGGQGYRADFGIVGTRVLVEFDGRSKYGSSQDLWDEKRREDRIRALGWEVVRVTWKDLQHPERVRTLIEAALRRAAASRGSQ